MRHLHALLAAALLLGCGGTAATSPRSAADAPGADAPDLPRGSFVEETYRFALTPTPGWEVVERQAVQALNADASAAMHAEDGDTGWGMVLVEHLVGVGLDDAARLLLEGIALEDATLVEDERITFADRPARRLVVQGHLDGTAFRFEYVLLISRDHLYTLTAWRGAGSSRDLSPFFDAFVLLPGLIGEARHERVLEARGPLWRVHEGRYENLASRLQVEAPEPWSLVVGDALSGINPDADVGFRVRSPDVWGIVISEQVPPEAYDRMRGFLERTAVENAGGQVVRRDSLPILGEAVPANVMHTRGLEMVHAVRCADERCIQLLVWYPIAAADQARSIFRAGFPRIAPLADPSGLEAALRVAQRERRQIGLDHALRGSRYTDFQHGLILEVPADGHFQLWAGSEARGFVDGTDLDLYLFDPISSLHGMLVVEPVEATMDVDAYHRAVLDVIGLPGVRADSVDFGARPGRASEGETDLELGRMRWVVHTTVANGHGFRLVFWGWPDDVRAHRDQLRRITEQLAFTGAPLPLGQMRSDGTWVDHRMGFTLPLPGTGWRSEDATPPRLAGPAGMRLFTRSEEEVVMALVVDPGPSGSSDGQAAIEAVTELMVRRFANQREGAVERPPMRWLGREGRRFEMPNGMQVLISHDGQQVYALLTHGVDLAALARGFQLTP